MTREVAIFSDTFGTLPSGAPVSRHQLRHSSGASVSVIEYGAIITSIIVPDREGIMAKVTAGYSDLEGYLQDTYFLGAVVGRYANRIARGRLTLNGTTYELPQNQASNHLHGGAEGFYRAHWRSRCFETEHGAGVELTLRSPSGHAGYPGALDVVVRYHFSNALCLAVEYQASTDHPTVVNLTQHTYFNLAGSGSIADHELRVRAERYTPTDDLAIPTGVIAEVAGTALDFRSFRRIGERIDSSEPQIQMARGYDHNFVLDAATGELCLAAELRCGKTGRSLNVSTTEPGMQLYSGNFLPHLTSAQSPLPSLGYREALCLETQHFPDSPNRPDFPSTRLDPGQVFRSKTEFAFGIE